MAGDYTTWLLQLPIKWLTANEIGQAYSRVFGTITDNQADLLRQAARCRMPLICPPDALPFIAQERDLIQGPTEIESHFRTRLQTAWQVYPFAGTVPGLMIQLYYQGYNTDMYLIQQNGLYFNLGTINEADPNFPANTINSAALGTNPLITDNLGAHPPWWSFFLRSNSTPIPNDYFGFNLAVSDTKFGSQFASRYVLYFDNPPASWSGGVPSASQLNTIKSIVDRWGPARATFEGLIVRQSGKILGWSPTRTLGAGVIGGTVRYYLSLIGAPTITSFTPSGDTGGATVTITGTSFDSVESVTIAGHASPTFHLVGDTVIKAVIPTGLITSATGPITIVTSYGTVTSTAQFTIVVA